MLKALALRLARTRPIGRALAWMLTHMTFAIPAHYLKETLSLVAFCHPSPGYPVHIILLPRRDIASLSDLGPQDTPFLADLAACVKDLVEQLDLEPTGYRLIANGGAYQDFPRLHFHLVSGERLKME
jgi:histidine triad (HIT) family protein